MEVEDRSPKEYSAWQFSTAKKYLSAFEALSKANPEEYLFPMYFLLTHALELTLKSWLVAHGVSEKDLRDHKVRHCLPALFHLCKGHHLPEIPKLEILVGEITKLNMPDEFPPHNLRYPHVMFEDIPAPAECAEIMKDLIGAMNAVMLRIWFQSRAVKSDV